MKDKYASRYWQRSVQGAAQPRALPRAETSVRSMYIVFTKIARDADPSPQPHSHRALLSAHVRTPRMPVSLCIQCTSAAQSV